VRRLLRAVARFLAWTFALLLVVAAGLVTLGWAGFGHAATAQRLDRVRASPEWQESRFVDPQPILNDNGRIVRDLFHSHPLTSPDPPLVTPPVDLARLAAMPASGLRVTWFGHSSTLVDLDGAHVLTDPMWSERVSPFPPSAPLGPRRFYPPPIAIADLPPIDAVVISHDHFDHLDQATVQALAQKTEAVFVVPLGIGAHLAYWGVPESRIVELDWWQSTTVHGLTLTCTPARHASGRFLTDRDHTLWGGFSIAGPAHRVFYSGDSGFFPGLRDIGTRLGPFDLAMIEAGQYDQAWPDWHMGPERAVQASELVRARRLLPVHWALFALANHVWTEPVERVLAAAKVRGVSVLTPAPGQSVEPTTETRLDGADRWWPALPWVRAEQRPLVTSGIPADLE
jgi:L-ascorbate metabolism protein UlaG (beta-lactamase superfamily)